MGKSITSRIIISYIWIIVCALLVVGIVFTLLARFYTERQTMQQLVKDAGRVTEIVAEQSSAGTDITSAAARQELRMKVFSQIGSLESNFVLVSRAMKILYPKNEDTDQFSTQLLPKISKKLTTPVKKNVTMRIQTDGGEYLVVVLPSRGNIVQQLQGWVILYSPVGPIEKIIGSLIAVLLLSLVISAIIAAIAGSFFARSIARPIVKLKKRSEELSRRNFDGTSDIHTGDELEELASSLDKMASELKEYDISQKRFFQNASHELKTPLMSIQGYAEGLKDGVFEKDGEALDIIVDESKRLKRIVDELIFLSKIESQEDFYKFEAAGMNDVIEKGAAKLKGISEKNGIGINLMLYKDATLVIDRDKMTQALVNIIGNCLRYARSEVNIITSNDGKRFEITIRDDGDGFDEAELGKIFERFYKGRKGDSGLGLPITKAIVEKHGGTVSAANAQDGGAEFRISLPVDGTGH